MHIQINTHIRIDIYIYTLHAYIYITNFCGQQSIYTVGLETIPKVPKYCAYIQELSPKTPAKLGVFWATGDTFYIQGRQFWERGTHSKFRSDGIPATHSKHTITSS